MLMRRLQSAPSHQLGGEPIELNGSIEENSLLGKVLCVCEPGSEKPLLVKSFSVENASINRPRLEKLASLNHENLLKLHGFFSVDEQTTLIIEKFDRSLHDEIIRRKTQMEYYSEQELWSMATSLISAFALMQKSGLHHGNVCPQQVAISPEGKVQIFDSNILGSSPLFKEVQEKIESMIQKRGLYSPLVMENLNEGCFYHQHDLFKSDVFSFGMTILNASTLTDVLRTVYMWSVLRINMKKLQDLLAEIRSRYSRPFCELLLDCLVLEELSLIHI
eukprot:TRINITY_DN8216_c0_g1_i1.p1 TRINITY_DN8216_c0_g1~~TRINITY_DN8216_c0_g1_i1.p1  ORF type:complete len:276 (+),score=30.24 TRINITY_DN8216_c0_g1_i1:165-992(+)